MSAHDSKSTERPPPDAPLVAIADYARNAKISSATAYDTARYCLMDTLACGFQALKYPACRKLLGPVVPGAVMPGGARVPGTSFELEPVQAAFNIGAMIRWLDFNDTWLAAEWGHPSDNLGGILAVADYLARHAVMSGRPPLTVRDLLTAMIKAHEIQGVLALENSFNRVGLDHVLLERVASTAVVASLLGGTESQVVNAVSNAWIDGGALRTYRHAPNTGSRKSWAAGDATSRAVRLALIALTGEMGYPSALSAKTWGFSDVLFRGKPIALPQPFDSYVMENVLFKISYPACASSTRWARSRTPPTAITASSTWWRCRSSSGTSRRRTTRTRWPPTRASMPCAHAPRCARTPPSRASTTRPTSAISATPCRSSSAAAAQRSACRSIIRSVIACGARKACRCS